MENEPLCKDRRAIAEIAGRDMNLEPDISRGARDRQPMRDKVSVISNEEKETGHEVNLRVREDRRLDPRFFTA